MTPAVHQFLPTFAGGDAIGGHVLALQRILRRAGYDSEIYADEAKPEVRAAAHPYREFTPSPGQPAWLLYHLSTGSPMAEFLIGQAEASPLAVYYHNITPAGYFERWNPEAAESVRSARAQMRRLAAVTRFAMANSRHSEEELRAEGFGDTHVVPVLVDLPDRDAPGDAATAARLARAASPGGSGVSPGAAGGHHWLFVGRIAPNKCQHDVIGAFAVYRALFDPAARLSLVGGKTSELYFRALEVLAAELGVTEAVDFADFVTPAELLAYYRSADVFVSLSEHEGFCVPILEAMHFGIPVVARGAAAVPETVGDAGLVLPGNDPVVTAAAVDRVLSDPPLRARLVAAGRDRLSDYSIERTGARLLDLFGSRRAEVPARG